MSAISNSRKQYPPRRLCLVLLLAFLVGFVHAERHERLIESWQPTHFEINLALDKSLSRLDFAVADVRILVRQPDVTKIDFDFGVMPVSAVKVGNDVVRFVQHDAKLDVYLARPAQKIQKLIISVTYSGVPQDGLILTKDRDGNPSAVGDNWADRVHNWIPCFDHPSAKASVRFTVTASTDYSVVANGVLESSTTNPDMTRTWIYTETKPVSPYNMVIAAGRFASGTLKSDSPVPISYYVPQSDKAAAEQSFSSAGSSVLTFSNLVGPYPYKKLALIVGATRFGGMENANTIVFPPTLFHGPQTQQTQSKRFGIPNRVEEVVAHEIAHQWFGDSVTEATWADLWLSEGFATYFAGLFLEQNEGKERFRDYMRDKAASYLKFEKTHRTPIHDTETEKLFDLLSPNNYEKGGWVLHGLRGILGDKAFFNGLRNYFEEHKESTATTEDLRAALEKSSGRDLRYFFKRWVYQSGHPIYQISWKAINPSTLEITLLQIQEDEAFLQPITVEIVSEKGQRRETINPSGKETTVKVKSPTPKMIVVDPDEYILKEVIANRQS